jgi:predicted ATPase
LKRASTYGNSSVRTYLILDSNWYLLLAKAHACAGRLRDAREALKSAFRAANGNGEHILTAELHRFDGELRLASSGADAETEAENCFQTAIGVARKQKAKLWELRAARSLARLWLSQGKIKEAHDLLEPVYRWFTEGFDTKDLKEAKALLSELEVTA